MNSICGGDISYRKNIVKLIIFMSAGNFHNVSANFPSIIFGVEIICWKRRFENENAKNSIRNC